MVIKYMKVYLSNDFKIFFSLFSVLMKIKDFRNFILFISILAKFIFTIV